MTTAKIEPTIKQRATGLAIGALLAALFFWCLTLGSSAIDDLSVRPWALAPLPPRIPPPCIVTPAPVYEWPGTFAKSQTVAPAPHKKGKKK